MVSFSTLLAFAIVSLSMVCSPGPNMIYLILVPLRKGVWQDLFLSWALCSDL